MFYSILLPIDGFIFTRSDLVQLQFKRFFMRRTVAFVLRIYETIHTHILKNMYETKEKKKRISFFNAPIQMLPIEPFFNKIWFRNVNKK